jgi:hypothetical protein
MYTILRRVITQAISYLQQ